MDNVKKLLDEEIESRIKELKNYDPGSEQEVTAVKNIAVLCEARNADNKHEQKIERIVKYAFDGITFAVGLIVYGHWYRQGLEFEQTGTFTSKTVQNLTKNFKPIFKK